MFGNGDGRILRDVAGNLFGALLYDETAETTEIHVVLVGQRRLDACLLYTSYIVDSAKEIEKLISSTC